MFHSTYKFFVAGFLIIILCSSLIPQKADAAEMIRMTSSLRRKLNDLGDEQVKNIPLPLLFGASLKTLTPNFGDARGGGTRSHEGLDIMAPKGVPIVSPTKAVVVRTGTGSSSGKFVNTMNPGGETFIYMHLNEISVKEGDVLAVGGLVGFVGNTGNASGGAPHLHFEIRDTKRKPTDPYPRITKEFTLEQKIQSLRTIITKLKK